MEEKNNNWGGKRPFAGRKPLPKNLKRLPKVFYLNEEENKIVKEFVKCLKERKKQEEKQN